MYKALKSAQNEIQETLLKFVDEVTNTSKCSRAEPCQCGVMTQNAPKVQPVQDNRLKDIEITLNFLHQNQNTQYEVLVGGIKNLNESLTNLVRILSQQTVQTATTIPNLSPQAEASDLKNVHVSHVDNSPGDFDDVSAIEPDDDITPDMGDADVPEEEEEGIEVEEEGIEVEEEAPEVEEEEEEEGIEVEEWTYKGRKFFKDTENTVYANENGELGDPIGLYDPVKNIVKKLAISS
jgi:hypothetical protein